MNHNDELEVQLGHLEERVDQLDEKLTARLNVCQDALRRLVEALPTRTMMIHDITCAIISNPLCWPFRGLPGTNAIDRQAVVLLAGVWADKILAEGRQSFSPPGDTA